MCAALTDRAKNIQNRAHINEDPKDAVLREFQKEIEELKRQLAEDSDGEAEGGQGDGKGGAAHRRKRQRIGRQSFGNNAAISVVVTLSWRGCITLFTSGSSSLSPSAAAKAWAQLERERAELQSKTGLVEEERDVARQELGRREEELVKAQ